MTAAGHLATYEAAGPAAVRAHLAVEHPASSLAVPGGMRSLAATHRLLHAHDDDPAPTFPEEAPA